MFKTLEQNMLNKYFSKPETLFTFFDSFEMFVYLWRNHILKQLHKQHNPNLTN